MKWEIVDSDGVADLKCKAGDECDEPAWDVVMYDDGTVYFQCRGCADQVEMKDAFEIIRKRPAPRTLSDEERTSMIQELVEGELNINYSDRSYVRDTVFEMYEEKTDAELKHEWDGAHQ